MTTLLAVTSTSILMAQAPVDTKPSRLLPGGLASTSPNPEALTAEEKAKLTLKNTFGPRALGNRLFVAGIDQLRNDPREWGGGMEGFGKRFGDSMARLAIRNSIRLGTDVAFKIDPRYDRCDCSGFWKRTGHAWKRVVVSRSDSGREMPALSNFTAGFVTPLINSQWYPDRLNTWDRNRDRGTFYLGWRGVNNMVREFWPEMKRKIPFGRN